MDKKELFADIFREQFLDEIFLLDKEIKKIQATGLVAPPGCWIAGYLAYIEVLQRAIDNLLQSSADLIEEAEKYK